MQSAQARINSLSQTIQLNPTDCNLLQQRSQAYHIQGDLELAISDLSKSMLFDPTYISYVKRAQLFKEGKMFLPALNDIQQAKSRYEESKEIDLNDIQYEMFMEKSVCVHKCSQIKQVINDFEDQPDETIEKKKCQAIIDELMTVKQIQIEKKVKEEVEKEMKKFYQMQQIKFQQLINLHALQLNKLKNGAHFIDFEQKFRDQITNSTISQKNQQKLLLYFSSFSSQLEKYYTAAKNLGKMEDKTFKFQDLQQIIVSGKKNTDYWTKLYKLFDKYGSKIQKIESIIKQIPYIGIAFNIIKSTMKAKGWVQQLNLENQCHNIELMATNVTSFNQVATAIGYFMTYHYQYDILGSLEYRHSRLERLTKKFKEIKLKTLGKQAYKHYLQSQMERVKEIGHVHASIIMVAVACRQLKIDGYKIKETAKQSERGAKSEVIQQIWGTVDAVQEIMAIKIAQKTIQMEPISTEKEQKTANGSRCIVY